MAKGKASKLIALPGATVTMKEADLMEGGRPEVEVDMPCPAYLIEHPKGLALFDTGCHPQVAIDPRGYWGRIADYLRVRYSPDLTVDSQIKALGYRLDDVKFVVVSHLHLDHSGGMHLFPRAQFFIMEGELPYAYWPRRESRAAFILNDLLPTRRFNWRELPGDTDLFDDGSLVMLKTAGHTPGESSLMVNLPNRAIVLTGDTVHIRRQLETCAPMPTDWDRPMSSDAIRRLKEMQDRGEVRLLISHDPEDWAEFPHSPTPIE
jgi:N-acyl homoserine lactone hydrolase